MGVRLLKRRRGMNRKAEGRIDNFFPNKAKQAEFVAQRALNNKQKLSLLFGCFQGRRMKVFCSSSNRSL